MTTAIDPEDMDALGQLLRLEKAQYARMRSLTFMLFLLSFGFVVLALIMVAKKLIEVSLAQGGDPSQVLSQLWLFQLLGPLIGAAVASLGYWWSVQSCLNSIERALFAAENRRHALFAQFVGQISCASDKKKKLWAEVVKGLVM